MSGEFEEFGGRHVPEALEEPLAQLAEILFERIEVGSKHTDRQVQSIDGFSSMEFKAGVHAHVLSVLEDKNLSRSRFDIEQAERLKEKELAVRFVSL